MLNEGLPRPDPKKEIEDLKSELYDEANFRRFFPDSKKKKYMENFAIFDRDNNDYINFKELKELLISIGQPYPSEEELKEYYDELEDPKYKGINFDALIVIVFKKIKDADKEAQLFKAFKIVKDHDKEENKEEINCEMLKELLMTMGQKWTEEKADEFLKEFDPKGEGKFKFDVSVKKLMKRNDESKKKKS